MAISYEDWKTQYEGMTTEQQKNYANMVKGNATAEEYANRYIRESQSTNPTPTPTPSTPTPASTPAQPVEQPTAQQPVVQQQQTPVSTVPEIKQEGALKPLSQDYYNQTSEDSQIKIINNLNNYKQSNPEYFTDYESFKRNFSYDARNDAQKNTLDQWYKGYTQGLNLSNQPVTDLYTQFKNGSLSNTDLEALRVSNPSKYAELQNQINRGSIISAYDNDSTPTDANTMWDQLKNSWLQNMITNLNTAGSGASGIFDDYQAKMESPEMVGLGDEAAAKQEEIEKITADIDSIKKTVEAEYAGKGASRAKINAIISDRTYDLQLQLRSLNSEYNRIATQYNNRMTQYQNEFQLQLQEYQLGMQERNQRMQELGFAMDLMNFETNDQKAEREWNYWVKQQEYMNGDINSKDYSTRYKAAIKSVENLLSQYQGIPMVRSAEQMAEDILKNMDSKGTTLGQELSDINKMIQQKPEYKYLYNQTYVPQQKGIQGTYKIGDQEYVLYNDQLIPSDQFNSMFGGASGSSSSGAPKPYDVVDSRALSMSLHGMNGYSGQTLGDFVVNVKNWDGKKGGQCGAFVNNYLQSIGVGRYYDNDISTKLNSVNTDSPKVGSVAVFDYGYKSSDGVNHGHVGIVTKVNGDGSIEVLDSNYNGDEVIHKRTIKLDSPSLKGFFDPSRGISEATAKAGGQTGGVEGSLPGIPLSYERAIRNLVPAALQNSDKEREALDKIITNGYNGGVSQTEIALSFMGFNVNDEKNKDFALSLADTIRTLDTENPGTLIQNISDLINGGNYTAAIQTVENAVSKVAKSADNYIPENSVKTTIYQSDEISKYLNSLKNSPVGVVSGTMEDWLGKLSSKKSKELRNKIALLSNSLDIKDKAKEQQIIPQLTDNPSVFMNKLNSLNDKLMQELNGWRNIYGLPSLNTSALNNYSNRIELYKNKTSATPSTPAGSGSILTTPTWQSKYQGLTGGMTNIGGFSFNSSWNKA